MTRLRESIPPGTPVPLPLETTLGHLIRRAQQVHTALWTAEFDGEITGPQYAVLSVLTRNPTMNQRSAGRLASLDKSSAADVMARLERSGWLGRERTSPDGRRNVVELTAVARTALRYITPRVRAVQDLLLESLPAHERREFVSALARVAYLGHPPAVDATDDDRPALPLATTPGHLIRRAEQIHRSLWTRRVGTGLTPSQYGLLSALAWNPGIDQSTAGELASLDKSTTADVVARLAQRNYFAGTEDAVDRRRKVLTLAETARRDLAETTASVALVQADLMQPLAHPLAEQLIAGLQTVAYRLPIVR